MPRPRFQREPCDCLDCTDPSRTPAAAYQTVQHAAALQDPPPKCLIIYADGALLSAPGSEAAAEARTTVDEVACPHLDGVARDGCSGVLALETPAAGSGRAPMLDRLAQLFGLHAAARLASSPPLSLAKRFNHLAAAFISSSEEAVELATWAGFQTCMGLPQLVAGQQNAQPALSDVPTPQATAMAAANLLGLRALQIADAEQQRAADDADDVLDMLWLHLARGDDDVAAEHSGQLSGDFADATARIEWLDAMVRHLNALTGVRERLLLTVVLGSGGEPLTSAQPLLQPGGGAGGIRPRQSFELCGDEPVAVDLHAPLLAVQRLPAVVRVDACGQLSLAGCCRQGGAGAILAQRLLPELAYKLGRAPKYGA